MKSGKIRHIVIFVLKPGVDTGEVVGLLRTFGKNDPNVLEWTVAESLDTRKGNVVIENALFPDETAFEKFKTSRTHKGLGEKMSLLADWLVADYTEPS
jgi:hypothetical protein